MRLASLLALLAAVRVLGAALYLVHDCDEVYNYWEPLHFLLKGTGMQTWEYRCGAAFGFTTIPVQDDDPLHCFEMTLSSICAARVML